MTHRRIHSHTLGLTSYPSKAYTSKGIGGIVKTNSFFVPLGIKIPKVNTQINVLDQELHKKSDFEDLTPEKPNPKLKAPPINELTSTLMPIKLKESEVKKLSSKRKSVGVEHAEKPKKTKPSSSRRIKHQFNLV
jgi:hypothetical protein